MLQMPAIMGVAQQMARHAAARQVVISQNIAHADTPGYKAQDVPDFAASLQATTGTGAMRRSHAAHFGAFDPASPGLRARPDPTATAQSPNGNTVSLEQQMMHAAETRLSHDLALSVYAAARGILRSALGS